MQCESVRRRESLDSISTDPGVWLSRLPRELWLRLLLRVQWNDAPGCWTRASALVHTATCAVGEFVLPDGTAALMADFVVSYIQNLLHSDEILLSLVRETSRKHIVALALVDPAKIVDGATLSARIVRWYGDAVPDVPVLTDFHLSDRDRLYENFDNKRVVSSDFLAPASHPRYERIVSDARAVAGLSGVKNPYEKRLAVVKVGSRRRYVLDEQLRVRWRHLQPKSAKLLCLSRRTAMLEIDDISSERLRVLDYRYDEAALEENDDDLEHETDESIRSPVPFFEHEWVVHGVDGGYTIRMLGDNACRYWTIAAAKHSYAPKRTVVSLWTRERRGVPFTETLRHFEDDVGHSNFHALPDHDPFLLSLVRTDTVLTVRIYTLDADEQGGEVAVRRQLTARCPADRLVEGPIHDYRFSLPRPDCLLQVLNDAPLRLRRLEAQRRCRTPATSKSLKRNHEGVARIQL